MSTFEEIDQAVKVIKSTGHEKLAILHCVSIYPTKDENININNIVYQGQNSVHYYAPEYLSESSLA